MYSPRKYNDSWRDNDAHLQPVTDNLNENQCRIFCSEFSTLNIQYRGECTTLRALLE